MLHTIRAYGSGLYGVGLYGVGEDAVTVSIVPKLIDAVVTRAKAALPSVQVFDGFGVSSDPGDFLMIGVDDPDGPNPANTAAGTLEFATMRTPPSSRDELGELTCAALSWNGNADPQAARNAVFAIADSVDDFVRADPTLGLSPSLLWTKVSSYDFQHQQDGDAAIAQLTFHLGYHARV